MSEPNEPEPEWKVHFDRGVSAGEAGDLEEAVRHFTGAIELAPREPYPRYELGYTLSLLGRHQDALAELRRANELSPGFFLVQTEIYLCEQVLTRQIDEETLSKIRRLQRLTDAGSLASPEGVSLSRGVIEAAPRCALGHYYLGKALFEQDRVESESALRHATDHSPDDTTAVDAFTHIGLHREAAGDLDSAQRFWSDTLKRYRGNPHTEMIRTIMEQRGLGGERPEPGAGAPSSGPGGAAPARELTEDQIREHDEAYQRGWALVEGELLIGGPGRVRPLGLRARRQLREAIGCFKTALKINPEGWQALWALGKIQQRLGKPKKALEFFAKAHEIDPSQPDVAREAGITATDLGDGPAAVRYTRAAIAAKPDDPGLVSNLALAYLIGGNLDRARTAAAEAASRAPDDPITKAVRDMVEDVAQGKRPRPVDGREFR